MTSKDFAHKKSLGQHFLNSEIVPQWMCDAGQINSQDLVFEIGPGSGVLTREILNRGAQVIALEADERAITILEDNFASEIVSKQLTIHKGDARKIDFMALNLDSRAYKCVSNIPYYLSGLLFRSLLETDFQPTTLVFLVQKEVATRIARDKKASILSLSVKAYGDPQYIKTVSAGHFNPPPKVDSAIIAVNNISKQNFKTISEDYFFEALHLAFGQKRKQLAGNLKPLCDREVLVEKLRELGYADSVRAEDIEFSHWFPLLNHTFSTAVKK